MPSLDIHQIIFHVIWKTYLFKPQSKFGSYVLPKGIPWDLQGSIFWIPKPEIKNTKSHLPKTLGSGGNGIPSVKSNDAYLHIDISNLMYIFVTKCIFLMQKWQPNFTVRDLLSILSYFGTTGDKKVHAIIYENFLSTLQTCLIFYEYEHFLIVIW